MGGDLKMQPSISIIVNTNGRVKSLERTLESFRALDYPKFEVCVVVGPTRDGSHELGQRYAAAGEIKYAECNELNLSQSRNIGIQIAAGDILAFIDDDGIPEPEWLSDLAAAYQAPGIVGAGGCTYDHTGHSFQARFMVCDRLGNADLVAGDPNSIDFCYPLATKYAGLLGTNSSFLRSAVVEIGGFDEEYEYYLDETDLCVRLIDNGGLIKQLPRAHVHHKFAPSHLRNEHRALSVPFPVMKNKIYFALANGRLHHTMSDIIRDTIRFFDTRRLDIEWCVANGRLDQSALDTFDQTSDRAWKIGMERGLSGVKHTQPATFFADPEPLVQFPTNIPTGPRRRFVFLSQTYLPGVSGGNARHTHDIASAIAALGHIVHVMTKGQDFSRVDLEDGVWVHRIAVDRHPQPGDGRVLVMPQNLWDYSASLLQEIRRLHETNPVDAIEAVSWDCEAAAVVLDGQFPCAVNIVTSLAQFLDTHPELANNADWMANFGAPMLAMERRILCEADMLVAASQDIVDTLTVSYDLNLDNSRVSKCVHGLGDMRSLEQLKPKGALLDAGKQSLLFVGRLELRKGVDILLDILPDLLSRHSGYIVWLAGDDSHKIPDGRTLRQVFEASPYGKLLAERVKFFGAVTDSELRWLYANCNIFVAPSRFESFGLIFVEAMMFAKPVVGCAAGGIKEVIQNGVTGLLARPDDREDLLVVLDRIMSDSALAHSLGEAGRVAFETHFSASIVSITRVAILESIVRDVIPPQRLAVKSLNHGVNPGTIVNTCANKIALEPGSSIEITSERNSVYVTFQINGRSGFVTISSAVGGTKSFNLSNQQRDLVTIRVDAKAHEGMFLVSRLGMQPDILSRDEIIVCRVAEADH